MKNIGTPYTEAVCAADYYYIVRFAWKVIAVVVGMTTEVRYLDVESI